MSTVKLAPGTIVRFREKPHEIKEVRGDALVIQECRSNHASITISYLEEIKSGELKLGTFDASEDLVGQDDWLDLPDKEKEVARERYEAIKPILTRSMPGSVIVLTKKVAEESGVSDRTIREWIKRWKVGGLASLAPMRRKQGGVGKSRLPIEVENIVNECIEEFYLSRRKSTLESLMARIGERCDEKGIKPPGKKAVKKRIDKISGRKITSAREGTQKSRSMYHVTKASFPGADAPLAYVQMDHTPLDVIVVDEESGVPIGRPFLTLAVDVFSRMPYGYHLTFEHPSYISAATCLLQGVLPKTELLKKHGFESDMWPVYGLPGTLHLDNGKEFRSKHIEDLSKQKGSDFLLEYRPLKTPQYGGHVERLFRTINSYIHELPGTTRSSVADKGDYDSEKHAQLTLDDMERYLLTSILEYVHKPHRGINSTPLEKWNDAYDKGLFSPVVPKNLQKFIIDTLPFKERTIQKSGISLFDLKYSEGVLQTIRNNEPKSKSKPKYRVKYDPRDLSKVYIYNPIVKKYEQICLIDRSIGSISLLELNKIKARSPKGAKQAERRRNLYYFLRRRDQILEESSRRAKETKRSLRNKERDKRGKDKAIHNKLEQGAGQSKPAPAEEKKSEFRIDMNSLDLSGIIQGKGEK